MSQRAPSAAPTWPPDYSGYQHLHSLDDILNAIDAESKSARAPESYKSFLAAVHRITGKAKETLAKVDELESQLQTYTSYLTTASSNYEDLVELYTNEHAERLKLDETIADLKRQIAEKDNAPPPPPPIVADVPQTPSQPESTRVSSAVYQWLQRELVRQAMGRQRLEQNMIRKLKEMENLRQQLQETQASLAQKSRDLQLKDIAVEKLTNDNRQLVAVYLQMRNQLSVIDNDRLDQRGQPVVDTPIQNTQPTTVGQIENQLLRFSPQQLLQIQQAFINRRNLQNQPKSPSNGLPRASSTTTTTSSSSSSPLINISPNQPLAQAPTSLPADFPFSRTVLPPSSGAPASENDASRIASTFRRPPERH